MGTDGEPDDPYGYLYRPGPGEETAPTGTGAPATQHPRRMSAQYIQVGQAQAGATGGYAAHQQQHQQQLAQQNQQSQQNQQGNGEEATQPVRQVPEPRRSQRAPEGGNRTPLIVFGVVVVVVAIVVGVVLAVQPNDDDKKKAGSAPSTAASTSAPSVAPPPPPPAVEGQIGATEAEAATLAGGAVVTTMGEKFTGTGVVDMSAVGSTMTWTVEAPEAGTYYLALKYINLDPAAPGDKTKAQSLTVLANDKANASPAYQYSQGSKSPVGTWVNVTLKKGANTVGLQCAAGNQCKAPVDQAWVEKTKPNF